MNDNQDAINGVKPSQTQLLQQSFLTDWYTIRSLTRLHVSLKG